MTLLSKNVGMKPKVAENPRSETVFAKQNLKMAINRTLTSKKNAEGAMDGYARGTVLVNNVNAAHRNSMPNVRTIVSGNKNLNIPNNELLRCKRKIHFISGQSYPGAQPASVARRNARERNRVKQVNNGFATLRSHIPPSVAAALTSEKASPRNSSASKKLSKVETLKMAVEYIRSLQQMLEDHNSSLEKKVAVEQVGYEKQFEIDENYYSSSPETTHSGNLADSGSQYPESPCRVVFPKIEPSDPEYYHRQYSKSDPDEYVKPDIYQPKSENFNHELHETLTSEFYGARSPVKTYYLSQEDNANCDFKNPEKAYDHSALVPIMSDKMEYSVHEGSPEKVSDYRKRNRSPSLTVLNSVSANQVLQFSGQAFLQPHCRNPASLSPTVSEACPSPTPSFSSDHSSVHHGSVVSGSSGHLISSLSRLSTHMVSPDSFKAQLASPVLRVASPPLPHPTKCLTPPRTLSPLSAASASVAPDPSSPSNHSSYSFHKGSPEGYDNYDPVSPEEEELLDMISLWQQSH